MDMISVLCFFLWFSLALFGLVANRQACHNIYLLLQRTSWQTQWRGQHEVYVMNTDLQRHVFPLVLVDSCRTMFRKYKQAADCDVINELIFGKLKWNENKERGTKKEKRNESINKESDIKKKHIFLKMYIFSYLKIV